ncbi:MAG: trypsin-like serine protease [Alphaproteobacteria bacterium]|jgi:hypothetical protein|nr:trypsin-like serine protease [Alphaproteobacteria bacterium]
MTAVARGLAAVLAVAWLLHGGLASARAALPTPWAAVGRVDIGGGRFCSGTVIAPSRVLTAAHCLFHPATGRPAAPGEIVFQAGLYRDDAQQRRRPVRVHVPVGYVWSARERLPGLERDVAVLEFAEPIGVPPLALLPAARELPSRLVLARYGRSRPSRARVDFGCVRTGSIGALWRVSCPGEPGNSGAPLLAPGPDGPRLVAVVVAMDTRARSRTIVAVPLDGGRALPPSGAAQALGDSRIQ